MSKIYIYIGGCGVGWSSWKVEKETTKKNYINLFILKNYFN